MKHLRNGKKLDNILNAIETNYGLNKQRKDFKIKGST